MAVSYVAGSATSLGTINDQLMSWPIGHQVDDVCLLLVESANQAITLTIPSGFVEIPTQVGTGTAAGASATRLAAYWCRATSTSMPDVKVGDAGDHIYVATMTFRGCRTTGDPFEAATYSTNATSSTTFTWPSVTTTEAGSVVVFAAARMIGATSAIFSGWSNATTGAPTERLDLGTTSGNDGGLGVATTDMASAGSSGVTTATLATSSVAALLTVAFTPPTSSVQKPSTDTAAGVDSAGVRPAATTEASASADSATVTATASPSDPAAGADSVTGLTVRPTVAETAGAADSARVTIAATDASTGTEAAGGNQTPPVTDTATGTDTASSSSLVTAIDTALGSDTSSATVTASDAATGTDSAFLSYRDVLSSDAATGLDSATVIVGAADLGGSTEVAGSSTAATSTDTAQGVDSVTGITVRASEAAAGGDVVVPMNVGLSGTNTSTGTDTSSVRVGSSDVGAGFDTSAPRVVATDSVAGTDSSLLSVTQFSTDVGSATDSATVIVHAATDVATGTEGAFIFIEGVGVIAARVVRIRAESRRFADFRPESRTQKIREEDRLHSLGRELRTVRVVRRANVRSVSATDI